MDYSDWKVIIGSGGMTGTFLVSPDGVSRRLSYTNASDLTSTDVDGNIYHLKLENYPTEYQEFVKEHHRLQLESAS